MSRSTFQRMRRVFYKFMCNGKLQKAVLIALSLVWSISINANEPNLIDAVRKSDLDQLRSLLESGSDPNVRQADGATALHWSVHKGDLESVNLLLEAKANVNATNRMGASPLFLAARNGDAVLLEELLIRGANPNLKLEMGETILMTAARSGTVEGVRLLIEAGADLNNREGSREQTALM